MKDASNVVIVKFRWLIILSPARTRNCTALIAMTTTLQLVVTDVAVFLGQVSERVKFVAYDDATAYQVSLGVRLATVYLFLTCLLL
jgi:hypothetical protein